MDSEVLGRVYAANAAEALVAYGYKPEAKDLCYCQCCKDYSECGAEPRNEFGRPNFPYVAAYAAE
jgi:hypothetical protein